MNHYPIISTGSYSVDGSGADCKSVALVAR